MNKKTSTILLVLLCLFGSVTAFFGMNLLFSDLANMFYSSINSDVISSLPFFVFALDFVLASLYVMRYVKSPEFKKRMTLTYLIILACFSFFGILASILTGVIVYGSFLAPYPFVGYTLICLILHILILIASCVLFYLAKKKMGEDEQKRKMNFRHVAYTIAISIFTFFAYNRFGVILMAPLFVHWRTLYLTWPFYASCLVPLLFLIRTVLAAYGVFLEKPKNGIIFASVCLGLGVAFSLTVILIGRSNTQFVSAVSPALPLERLASMPIDTVFYALLMVGIGVYELIYSINYYRRHKQ